MAQVMEMQVTSWITEDIVRMLKPADNQVMFGENIVTKHLTNMHMSTVKKKEIFSSYRQGGS